MPIVPIEFLSNDLAGDVYAMVRRFDSKFYDIDSKTFKSPPSVDAAVPLKRGSGSYQYLMSADVDIKDSELVAGYYSVYFVDKNGRILDFSSFEIPKKIDTDVAVRVMGSTVGNKTLRDSLKDTNDKVNQILEILKKKGF
jgi:hypothetical protein